MELTEIFSHYFQVLFVPDVSSSQTVVEEKSSIPSLPLISPSSITKPKEGDAFILLTDRRLSNESSTSGPQQDVGAMVWSIETYDFRHKCHSRTFPLLRHVWEELNGEVSPCVDCNVSKM